MLPHSLGTCNALVQADLELHTEFFADGLGLAHHAGGQLAGRREQANVFQCGVCQGTDRVKTQIAPHLEPYLGADVAGDRGLEARCLEGVTDGANAGRVVTVQLAQREAVAFYDFDHAGPDDFAGGVHHAANHAVNGNMPGNGAVRIDRLDGLAQVWLA